MANAIAAHGTLLQIGDGASPEVFTNIAEVMDISGPSFSLDTAEVTHQESPGNFKEYIPTLLDGGEVSMEINFLTTEATHGQAAGGLLADMVARNVRNFKIAFPESPSVEWAFAAIITAFELDSAMADQQKASVTLKITGQPTLA